ncbi:MurR/RpiR family transcriptional regulator [Fodinicurvata sp. EGI_FJ10296]|uniref:MurR/RpiR family transcriptional regulator n=1 Tax=Fodinicurvata sp. EGI_FJ10296 TaxID=3231908 RepID=UPI003453BC0A
MTDAPPSFTSRMESCYLTLPPRLKKAATHLMAHADDVALYSMRDVAVDANVHPSTMVRLAKVLGYSAYNPMKKEFREWFRGNERFLNRARDLQHLGSASKIVGHILDQEASNLEGLRTSLSSNNVAACIDLLESARKLFVIGLRSCHPPAFQFAYACGMVRPNVHLVHGSGGTFGDELRSIGPEDALLAVTFAPYTSATVHAIEFAAEHDAQVILITDTNMSRIARLASHVLSVSNYGPSLFHTTVPATTLVHVLIAMLVVKGGQNAIDSIARNEEQLRRFHAYEDDVAG